MTATTPSDASTLSGPETGAAANKRWLFGPATDLLLGCGVGYVLLIALVPWFGFELHTLAAIGLLSSLLIATPHYGATLLRVYASRSDLRKYALFTIYASAIVWLGFVVGLYDLRVGSFLITLYFSWSPWHYAGQNYGLAVMFLRRRGVPLPDRTKKLLYVSFLLSYVLTFLTMHSVSGEASYGVGDFMGTRYYFLSLEIPAVGGTWSLFSAVLVAYLAATVAAALLLLRSSSAKELIPVACLAITQSLWFVVPHTWGWATGTLLESQTVAFLFVWAILGHSVQYLWVTTYYAVGTQSGRPRWTHLAATLAAGSVVWTLPALLFSAQWIGSHPYNMGLFLMIAAAVNLQHFVLDGAIWKLRDTGVGSVLLAPSGPDSVSDASSAWPGWVGGTGWAVGIALFAIALLGAWENISYDSARRGGDGVREASARERLVALGRDDPRFYLRDAKAAIRGEDYGAANAAVMRSLSLYPTPEALFMLGALYEREGQLDQALRAYRETVRLDARAARAWARAGVLLAGLGRQEAAIDALQRAVALAPDDATIASDLADIRSSASLAVEAGEAESP